MNEWTRDVKEWHTRASRVVRLLSRFPCTLQSIRQCSRCFSKKLSWNYMSDPDRAVRRANTLWNLAFLRMRNMNIWIRIKFHLLKTGRRCHAVVMQLKSIPWWYTWANIHPFIHSSSHNPVETLIYFVVVMNNLRKQFDLAQVCTFIILLFLN